MKNVRLGQKVIFDNASFEGYSTIGNSSNLSNSQIGIMSYIGNDCDLNHCIIGRYCSIADRVRVLAGKHPTHTFVSTHPAFYSTDYQYSFVHKQAYEEHNYLDSDKKTKLMIGNDVWIGSDVLLLEGIKVGDGAIIAAGACVVKDVEPYSIIGGVPAKKIKMRFTNVEISRLLENKWWNWTQKEIKDNIDSFQDINKWMELTSK